MWRWPPSRRWATRARSPTRTTRPRNPGRRCVRGSGCERAPLAHRGGGHAAVRRAEALARRTADRAAGADRAARSEAARVHPAGRRCRDGGGARSRDRDRRGPRARAAARRAGRHQGHHRCRRPADHLPLEDPARQRRQGRRGGDREAAPGGCDHPGQAVHARVRHRRPELRPAVSAGAQSVEPRASSGRLVVRFRRGRVRRAVSRWRSAPTPAARCATRPPPAASSG